MNSFDGRMTYRLASIVLTGLLVLAAVSESWAQTYPSRRVTLVVPFGPGGAADVLARVLAKGLEPRLGQPVIIENRPGAGAINAAQSVLQAPADGHTLLWGPTALTASPSLIKNYPFELLQAFQPVALAGRGDYVLMVNNDVPATTLDELVAYARANPGKLAFAYPGYGAGNHLSQKLLKVLAGLDIVEVSYKSSPETITGLLTNQVQLLHDTVLAAKPYIVSGQVRALVVDERTSLLPGVPSAAETNFPEFRGGFWLGILAPKNTPSAVVEQLNNQVNALLGSVSV